MIVDRTPARAPLNNWDAKYGLNIPDLRPPSRIAAVAIVFLFYILWLTELTIHQLFSARCYYHIVFIVTLLHMDLSLFSVSLL